MLPNLAVSARTVAEKSPVSPIFPKKLFIKLAEAAIGRRPLDREEEDASRWSSRRRHPHTRTPIAFANVIGSARVQGY